MKELGTVFLIFIYFSISLSAQSNACSELLKAVKKAIRLKSLIFLKILTQTAVIEDMVNLALL